jgi:hypothetical protein
VRSFTVRLPTAISLLGLLPARSDGDEVPPATVMTQGTRIAYLSAIPERERLLTA